jgi:hypothetical protein
MFSDTSSVMLVAMIGRNKLLRGQTTTKPSNTHPPILGSTRHGRRRGRVLLAGRGRRAPTPDIFPRNSRLSSWVSWEAFGFPSCGSRECKYQACWAAGSASMLWSRAHGVPCEVARDGSPHEPPDLRPLDAIDDTVFMLAMFDKVYEM